MNLKDALNRKKIGDLLQLPYGNGYRLQFSSRGK